jgi:2-aminoethylphosphonate-pyruvate transaminase
VHHETTTGRLNDVAAIGALCKRYGVALLLDAVSSFAGEEIRFEDSNLEACAATANKCLHGAPGVSFVLVKKSVFETRRSAATSLYLDLFKNEMAQRSGFSPFTQPTHVVFAMDEALSELAEAGGWKQRHVHYRALTAQVVEGCRKLDIPLLLGNAAEYSSMLTSYRMPKGVSYERLHDALKERGFVIYAGQGNYNGSIFRIAVMGDLDSRDIDRLTAGISDVVARG